MEVNEFNSPFLNTLSENLLSEKNKEIVLLGDLNIDLLKHEKDHYAGNFLGQMYSTSSVPRITSPTRITSHSGTLIDNIFSTDISVDATSGNTVTSISDHLAQFLFLPIVQFKTNNNKNIYQCNFKNFSQQIFLEDIQNLNWNKILELEKKDVDNYVDKFIRAKNPAEKSILYNEFKHYRNLVSKLSRISKAKHYHHYFTDHKRNMLKTWEGIKLLANINKRNNKTVTCLNVDGTEETDPFLISNHLNKLFSTIAQKIAGKIAKTSKHFSGFLTEPLQSKFFLTPTLPDEVQEIIKSLNNIKAI